jgi:hypothetical protein
VAKSSVKHFIVAPDSTTTTPLPPEKWGDSLKPSSLKEARSQVRRRDRVINHPNFSPHPPRFKTWVKIIVVLTSFFSNEVRIIKATKN